MTKFRALNIFLTVFAVSALSSCENEDDGTPKYGVTEISSVNDIINSNRSLSTL